MKLLLDTQAFIWMFAEPGRLPSQAFGMMRSSSLLLSIATPWEMMIKYANGKLHINDSPDVVVEEHIRQGIIATLPIELRHISLLRNLPHHHRDPFDRIIIAQALAENIPIASGDRAFDAYDVRRVWE